MNAKRTPRRSLLQRFFRLRTLLVAAVVLLGVVYLVWPARIHDIVSVDGMHRWAEDVAPPRYKIVWQPAYEVETLASSLGVDDIRPQLAEDGTALWFTRRKSDGGSDVYRAEVVDGVLQPGEPVQRLNSTADDVGPVFRPDGRRLYIYSNRPGGFGGFDLYVSDRTPDGWSEPRNLGPQVNSPAHEYSPAVSADGTRLFFASNQTPEMLRLAAEREPGEPGDQWRTTLRADQGLLNFDLYMAQRKTPHDPWGAAQPLQELNRPDADEGDPYISPSGAFLYYVSDRVVRDGEQTNFDIYRARIQDDQVSGAENLGSGVNTPQNELEPALSLEGFKLYFSRNQGPRADQPGLEEQYALYCSEAIEVLEETAWGPSKLGALLALLARNWWWLVLFALTLALLAALVWYLREMSLRRLPVPGFFLTALLIHILAGVGSFYVYFGPGIYRHMKKELAEFVVAMHMADENLHQSHEAGQEAYEKIADLKSVETVDLSGLARQVTELPSVPIPTDSPAPELPTKLSRDLPSDRFSVPPPEAEIDTEDPELARRRALERMMAEQIEIEQTQAAQQTPEQLARVEFDLARRQPAPQASSTPKTLRRRTLEAAMLLEREEVTVQRASDAPVQTDTDQQPTIQRTARTAVEPAATAEVPTEALAAPVATPTAQEQPAHVAVAVDRTQPSVRVAGVPGTLRRSAAVAEALQPLQADVQVERPSEGPVAATTTDQQPTTLERTTRAVAGSAVAAAAPPVETEALGAPVVGSPGVEQPAQVSVNVGRRETAAPTELASLPTLRRGTGLGSNLQLARADVTAEHFSDGPVGTANTDQQPTTLKRTSRAVAGSAVAAAALPVETEAIAGPVAGPKTDGQPAQVSVSVGRRETTTRVASAPSVLRRSSAVGSSTGPTLEDVTVERLSDGPVGIALGPAADVPLATKRGPTTPSLVADSPQPIETAALGSPTGTAASKVFVPQSVGVNVGRRVTAAPSPQGTALKLAGLEGRIGLPGVDQPSQRALEVASIAGPSSGKVVAELARATRVGQLGDVRAEVEAIAAEQPGAAAAVPSGAPLAGVKVGIDRPDAQLFQVPVKTSGRLGGRYLARSDRLVVGSLEKEAVDSPPKFSPHASRITRRPARAPLLLYAEDNIGLQAMFRLRAGESKIDLVQAFGGSGQTLEAVRRGLEWLKKHQHNDGYWSLHEFYNREQGKNYSGTASVKSDTAATGFGLLPFLGDGHTHVGGTYQSTVRKGLEWLVEHQKEDGDLATTTGDNTHMYAHAIAAIALCEAYGMSKDENLRGPAQRAIDFIASAQHEPSGGWRYNPKQDADTSVVGWQVMALKSGQMAALNIPQRTLDLVPKWLKSVERGTGKYEYQRGRGPTPAMTAEALLCLQYLGADRNDPRLKAGADYLLENLPGKGNVNSYYWYYGTQMMFHMQGEPWQQWNNALRDMLVETQVKDGHLSGTWDPAGEWEDRAGRVYGTALRLLMLEVYYRHLPLYQVLDQ